MVFLMSHYGKKIYISEMINWLDKKFCKKVIFESGLNDSFTLNNSKIKEIEDKNIKKGSKIIL